MLPLETSRRSFRLTMSLLIIFILALVALYIVMISHYYAHDDAGKIKLTNQVMSFTRAAAMTLEAVILIIVIVKLKRANVSRTDSGHLNMCDASLLVGI